MHEMRTPRDIIGDPSSRMAFLAVRRVQEDMRRVAVSLPQIPEISIYCVPPAVCVNHPGA